jgi:GxxExxY protein
MIKYLYQKESYDLIGAAMEVYNELGPGFLEAVYQDAFEIELQDCKIPFESQKLLTVYYRGHRLAHEYVADMVCYKPILVELKAVHEIHDAHLSQVLNYLKASGLAVGYVFNFGNQERFQWKRAFMSNNLTEDEINQLTDE